MRPRPNIGVVLLAVLLAFVSSFAVLGLLTSQKIFSNTGSITAINVEIYWDFDCTQALDTVDWGAPAPGDSIVKTIYVKNNGTAPMTLSMSCSAWSPAEAANYLTLSWDREDTQVNAGEVIPATLTFSVSPSITGITSFSFNAVIEGTG